MKKQSLLFNLVAIILIGMSTALSAADCCYPTRNNCYDWSIGDGKVKFGADWLYWKVTQDNLIIGSEANITSPTSALPQTIHGSYINQNFHYTSGYRVNLGYELPCDCWDIDVCYTYLPSHSKSRTFTTTDPATNAFNANVTDFSILGAFNQDTFLPPTSVFSKWNLTLNNIDVDLGRSICFGECLKIRPHIGFRATWFDQKLRFNAISAISGDPDFTYNTLFSEKFTGYGVEGGLWAEWQIGWGLSVVGHFGGSILYSKFSLLETAIATTTVADTSEELVNINGRATLYSGTPTVDYFVGLQYAAPICDMLASIYVGWEQHVLFDVNRLAHDGNLATQGLTLGMEFGF